MVVSTVIFFGLVLFGMSDVDADASLSALETRLIVVEGEILARKLTAHHSDITLNTKFEVLKSSLKEELAESVIPPLIKPLVRQAIADILDQDYVGNVISGYVLDEVHSLKANLQNTNTQLKAITQDLRHVERERYTYRKSLEKLRRRLTKDIQAVQLQLKQTEADLRDAKMMKSEPSQTNNDLSDTQQKINGLSEGFITLNTSHVMVKHEVESCTDGLHSLTTKLNQTNEDLLDTRRVIHGLTDDLMTLNSSCGTNKDVKPSEGNESLLVSSLSQVPLTASTTTCPETTAASTDPIQDPSQTVPPVPGTTQDADQHATPSAATGRDLWDASRHGDLETVRRILSAGRVDVNYRGGRWSKTPVMAAAQEGHRDVVELLVGEGADPSLVDSGGYNVLHAACWGGDLETVKRILSLDVVDINARNNYGETAADVARYWRHQRLLDLLVSRGAH